MSIAFFLRRSSVFMLIRVCRYRTNSPDFMPSWTTSLVKLAMDPSAAGEIWSACARAIAALMRCKSSGSWMPEVG